MKINFRLAAIVIIEFDWLAGALTGHGIRYALSPIMYCCKHFVVGRRTASLILQPEVFSPISRIISVTVYLMHAFPCTQSPEPRAQSPEPSTQHPALP